MRHISVLNFKAGETDYRLIDKVVIKEFGKFTERVRITRGLLNWLGYKQVYVPFNSPERIHGRSRFGLFKLIEFAITSVFAYSLAPLYFFGCSGLLITLFSFTLGVFVFIEMFLLKDPFDLKITGTAMLALLIIFLVGIILISLGVLSFYINNIYDSVLGRPLYVIRKIDK